MQFRRQSHRWNDDDSERPSVLTRLGAWASAHLQKSSGFAGWSGGRAELNKMGEVMTNQNENVCVFLGLVRHHPFMKFNVPQICIIMLVHHIDSKACLTLN